MIGLDANSIASHDDFCNFTLQEDVCLSQFSKALKERHFMYAQALLIGLLEVKATGRILSFLFGLA